MEECCSEIAQFYEGRSIFVTGATGCMGKVLVEKLLRSCPGIKRIFLLMRPTKGKDVSTRLKELMGKQVFDRVKAREELVGKVVAVEGDVTLPLLGLSSQDLQTIIDQVSIVFHSAATVRFDEDLKTAIELNVSGPRQMIQICHQMKHLEALVHVSTAFCNLDRYEVDEIIYPSSSAIDPIKLVEMIQFLSNELINRFTPDLLGSYPNTYTFSKSLAEQIIEIERGNIPLAIIRPSVVIASLKDPFPGWIDNLNGPTGLIAGVSKGVVRVGRIDPRKNLDVIPVDFSINLMIAAAWDIANQKSKEIAVYNSVTGTVNPFTWAAMREYGLDAWHKNPDPDVIWKPSVRFTPNYVWFKIMWIFLHLFPAYLVDLFEVLKGKKPRLVRLYGKIDRLMKTLEFFTTQQWRFLSRKSYDLLNRMSEQDQQIFYFTAESIDWHCYMTDYVNGIRRFILKEDLNDIQLKRKKRTIHRFYTGVKVILCTLFLLLVYHLVQVVDFTDLLLSGPMPTTELLELLNFETISSNPHAHQTGKLQKHLSPQRSNYPNMV